MRHPLIIPDLRELLHEGEAEALREVFDEYEPARMAELVEDLGQNDGNAALKLLEPRTRAEVVSYLDPERQVELVESMPPETAAEIFHHMPHDDRAALVKRLDDDSAEQILRRLAQAERDDILRLTSYEPGTAGSVMTSEYTTLPPFATVREAMVLLRREAPASETIYISFVVDQHRRLLGVVSLAEIIRARPTASIEDVMRVKQVFAHVGDDREEVAKKIEQYDLLALPIVDEGEQLVGIVTHDDALDILKQEQGEDLMAFGGVAYDAAQAQETGGDGGILTSVKRRVGWLLFLFGGGTLTGLVVRTFDGVQGSYPGIDFDAFIPLLIGTGGNAGSQTVGTVIRGLALGDIDPRRDFARILAREALTGLFLGAVLGPLGFVFTWLVMGSTVGFSAVIGTAILGICLWANAVGSMVPMLARILAIDPAVVSAPLISTLVDATGLLIFYQVARAIHRLFLA
jgi:magnesium transporter